ncbi:c-type cytochrome [Azohydromonas lata]|uniref:c-type cytochrome n=1 Tax=Azohydromonas lata TaxID=45677 RepID=UPI000834B761|nr:cytochrome c [Azohydromonas lata]
MKFRSLVLAAAAVGSVGMAVVLFQRHAVPAPPPHAPLLRPDDRLLVGKGERIYQVRCAACHGANLEGQADWREPDVNGLMPAPPHDESGHTWHHPDEQLFKLTKLGIAKAAGLKDYKTAMPAFEGVLSDEDIVAVLSFIKSRWPASVREKHNRMNAQYEAAKTQP